MHYMQVASDTLSKETVVNRHIHEGRTTTRSTIYCNLLHLPSSYGLAHHQDPLRKLYCPAVRAFNVLEVLVDTPQAAHVLVNCCISMFYRALSRVE